MPTLLSTNSYELNSSINNLLIEKGELMIYTLKTSLKLFIEAVKRTTACLTPIDWLVKINTEFKKATMEDGLKSYLADSEVKYSWGAWCLLHFEKEFDTDVRTKFLQKEGPTMISFKLYVKLKEISVAEDLILINKFAGKLPTAEKELSDGVITRDKEQ